MTVSSLTVKNSYNGDNTTTAFSYTFPIHTAAELQVIERSALGTETVKTLNSDYTITDNGAAGGSVNFSTAPGNGVTIVLLRNTSLTQEVDYISNDAFGAETHEGALDKLTLQVQEVQEEVDRSIKLSRTNTINSTEFTVDATSRAGKILGFDNAGELVVSQELGSFKGSWSASQTYAARDIVKDTSTNNIFLCNQGHTSSGSQPLTTNTDSGKWDLLVDAAASTTAQTAAASSATAAATSETNAASSAASALSHKNDSETAKTASETAQTAAETARTAAQTAQAAAEAALDNFDDRFLGAKTSDPSVDNDGNALTDGALYFDTTLNVMKVYDLGATVWRKIQLTATDQANLNTVAAQISPTNNLGTVAGLNTEITNLAGLSSEITNLNGIRTDISGVNSIQAAVSAVNTNSANINAVNNNSSNINTLAGISDLGNLATAHASVTTAANNLTSINSFANTYLGASGTAPTQDPDGSSLDLGDLYFDTASDTMKVYSSGGWINAGSAVNGTANRFSYTATAGQTTFTGADANGNTLAYDSGYVDIFLNGIKIVVGTDVTATSGTSVVLATGASVNDTLELIAYGTFTLSNFSITSANDVPALGSAGQALVVNQAGNSLEFSNASSAEVYGFEKYYNPSTLVRTVTVQSVGGSNKYFIDGVQQDTLELYEGNTYIFNYPSGHPFKFSTTSNGTHASGSEYTTGVTHNSSTQVTIVVASGAPTLYYYCSSHSGMGGQANTPTPANNAVRYITTNQGQDNITESQYANFSDVLFSASGFTFSLSNGELIATI
ncbi:tail fiber [uncultured Mediterranean phage uvMED]|nr:tail fiber [uncultured Mediterranean phage uvMED]